MVIRCQGLLPKTCVQTSVQWGYGRSRKNTGFAARRAGLELLLLTSRSFIVELGIVSPKSQHDWEGGLAP